LANTITLTPGTLTVDLSEDELTVHCLSQSFAAGIYSSKLERLLIELEE
jgi:multicomponent Na+:H+ antiporter subunit E